MPEFDPILSRRTLLAGTSGLILFGPLAKAQLPNGRAVSTSIKAMSKEIRLRGFGRLRPERLTQEGVSGISVACEDAEKADLLLAKFRGDITGFGHAEATDQGWKIAENLYATAYRTGERVTFATAERADLLAAPKEAVFEPRATVPMYLDRWDRHGLLFYYSAFQEPPGFDGSKQRYDFQGDFDFTQNVAHSGLVFWEDEAANDTAEGLMNSPWWDWARNEARKRKLPVHMNVTAIPTTWLLNRYREETALKMPQYSGSFYRVADPRLGDNGILSWGSTDGEDAELGTIQASVRRYNDDENVVGWLEPHSELGHGKQQLFLEYGPASARSFQEFLKKRYRSVGSLNERWGTHLAAWKEIQAPELAEFLGWNAGAFDLTGVWRIRHEEMPPGEVYNPDNWRVAERRIVKTLGTPPEWMAKDFDDHEWGTLQAPGDDRTMFLPKRPAVFRRRFDLPKDWNAKEERVWLYVWDLNMAEKDLVVAHLNGKKVGESAIPFWTPQWCVFEVTDQLQNTDNSLAIRLPNGYLGYRTYLSTHPPLHFPHLGPEMNARWVDFADWQGEMRHHGVSRGAEMIRQVDPNRPITFMSPDVYADGSKDACQRYGGSLHDTGLMGAFWCDLMPMLSRSSGLAYDLEPGGPCGDADDFRRVMTLWLTEGIQGLSYFMHVGDVIWRDDVRKEFERMRPLLELMGKHHVPKAEVALLFSQRCERILGYPWASDPNAGLENGYWRWNVGANLLPLFPRDGLTELDFANGNADAYRVVIDTSTTVTSPELLGHIRDWVRKGGTFIAFMQTGRHNVTEGDAWPISKLTGYEIASVERYDEKDEVPESEWRTLHAAPGQTVFSGESWNGKDRANGLRLRAHDPACQNLMLWDDGSVAVGMRPLGKGRVIHVAAKFSHIGIPDRIDVGENTPAAQQLTRLFADLLNWHKVAPVPGWVGDSGAPVLLRHTGSNNGLFDVWTLANRTKEPQTATLSLKTGHTPAWCRDVVSGDLVPIDGSGVLSDLAFGPSQTRAFVTPRTAVTNGPETWLGVQSGWWHESQKPSAKKLPAPEEIGINALSLDEDWAFLPLGSEDAASLAQSGLDDSKWERRRIGVWGLHDHGDVNRAVLRKRFTVPSRWTHGAVELWVQSWVSTTFLDKGRVFLDGKPLRDLDGNGLPGIAPESLKPGTEHVLALEIVGEGQLRGVRGNAWLTYVPEPEARIDLAGTWIPSPDPLHDDPPIPLPGAWKTLMARRAVTVGSEHKEKVATIRIVGNPMVLGVIVNGSYVRRHHHGIGRRTLLNITPWIRFGQTNEICLVSWDGPSEGVIESVELQFFDRKSYA
ncbi:hypothetical protein BH11ARM2_BH11ARM2_31790 [soil metagenome]